MIGHCSRAIFLNQARWSTGLIQNLNPLWIWQWVQENKTKQQTTYLSSPVCCLQLKLLNGAAVWGSDPHCPPALVVMLRGWLSSSGHGLCVPLKGSESVNTTSALPSSFTAHCVWGTRLCCLVCCWLSDLVSSQQAGPPFVCCACAQRRKDVFCTKAAAEHWKKSQMCSKLQSCHGKRGKVPESQKFWQPRRQCAQLVPKLIFCHNQCLC